MSTDTPLFTELNDGVLKITLNRPKANAFTSEMSRALLKALKNAGRNDEVRVVLLTGAGKLFSAGQDLTEFMQAENLSLREHLQKTYNPL
ncbi:MAG: enoyl-CoA hydratase/isomerase family protein, partial [Chloroflexi bacterium]|nr:enoyl-CoA hydratase/isomerase family protein [Chloroflexota bacterium]